MAWEPPYGGDPARRAEGTVDARPNEIEPAAVRNDQSG